MAEGDTLVSPSDVLTFWFDELTDRDWFQRSDALDRQIERRFRRTHLMLSREMPWEWRADAVSRLAAIIVFDQFPRNMFRGSPLAFATDGLARREAKLALKEGADQMVHARQRAFFYLPFEHSETLEDQDKAVELFSKIDNPDMLDYAERHRDVIRRFGRFPHRNVILGRTSTREEAVFLMQPGSSF